MAWGIVQGVGEVMGKLEGLCFGVVLWEKAGEDVGKGLVGEISSL